MEGKKTCHIRETCRPKETAREAKETFTRLHRRQYRTIFSSNDTLCQHALYLQLALTLKPEVGVDFRLAAN